jgi:hypothetical protein
VSIEGIKGRLGQSIAAAGVAKQIIEGVATDTVDTTQFARHTLHDSRHPEVAEGLACLKAATDELDLVMRRLDASATSASEFRGSWGEQRR